MVWFLESVEAMNESVLGLNDDRENFEAFRTVTLVQSASEICLGPSESDEAVGSHGIRPSDVTRGI